MAIEPMPAVIETDRLLLSDLAESDIPELVPLIGAREVAANTLRIPFPYLETHAREFLASPKSPDELRLAIRLRSNRQLVGGIGLHPQPHHLHAELGYWIGLPHWRKGYATEAARAVVEHGFKNSNLHRIYAHHFKRNPASGRVLQKIGMQYEGCMRQAVLKWGEFMDLELYAILREELRP